MKRPGFVHGVLIALVLSILGSTAFSCLDWFMSGRPSLLGVITGLSLFYIFYLLKHSGERVGRVTVVTFWILLTAILWLTHMPVLMFIIAQTAMLWLVRSLYYYASVLSAMVDLCLAGIGITAAVWAGVYTNSLFFSIWSFFLIQALFTTIPEDWRKQTRKRKTGITPDDSFEHAWRCAEAAVSKLSTIR